VKDKRVNDFAEFMALSSRDWHPSNQVVYRGVPDADFGMRPVIGRNPYMRNGRVDTQLILHHERLLLDYFRRSAPAYTKIVPSGDLDWLCLGRHYGLATRLLDMTSNPLVALFFAANPDSTSDFAVYRYWFSAWLGDVHAMDLKRLQRQKDSLVLYPRLTTERFVRQSSAFLVCHRPWEDFEHQEAPENLAKIVFPAETRNQIRQQLAIFGVTPSFVRPDLDGLCDELNDKVLHRKKFWFPLPPLQGDDLSRYQEMLAALDTGTRPNKSGNLQKSMSATSRLTKRSTGRAKKPRAG